MSASDQVALVTGGTGFVGSRLVLRLLSEGWRVHAVVRPTSKVQVLPAQQVGLHIYDGSTESLLEIVHNVRPRVAFHLAALSLAQHNSQQVKQLVESNILLGTQLAEAIAQHAPECSFINTGSFWQHYQGKAYSPTSLYAATKQAFEDILVYYAEVLSLRALTLVLFDTYGPGDPRPRLLNLLRRAMQEGTPVPLSAGEQFLDLVHVDDVVCAFVQAAHWLQNRTELGYMRFAVSSGQLIRLRDLVALCERIIGSRIPVLWGARPYRPREVMHPWQGGVIVPGWQPRISLEEGLAQVFAQS